MVKRTLHGLVELSALLGTMIGVAACIIGGTILIVQPTRAYGWFFVAGAALWALSGVILYKWEQSDFS